MLKTSTMFNLIELYIWYIMKSQDMCIHEQHIWICKLNTKFNMGWKHNRGCKFGHFHDILCLKYTPQNVLHLILGYTFDVWTLYFGFHKVNFI